MGHQGRDRTTSLANSRIYWFGMTADIDKWIKTCPRCVRSKCLSDRAPLHSIITTETLEIVCMYYLSLEPSKGGYQNILVITNHYTKFLQAYPTKDQSAKTTANILLHYYIPTMGLPQKLLSDRGGAFESKVIAELCSKLGIDKRRTTHHKCNISYL